MIVGLADRQVKYLSDTREGRVHDKRVCEEEGLRCPAGSEVYRDLGFEGLEMEGVSIRQPKKKPRGGELTASEKESNRAISRVRVTVEHVIGGVKRCRILKDVYRNAKDGYDDLVMDIASGLHNYRSSHRLRTY